MMTPDPHTTHPSGSPQPGSGESPGAAGTDESLARAKTREAMERARGELRSLSDQARQQAIETKEQAKSQGREYINDRKNRLGDGLHHISDAVRRAGEELRRGENSADLTRYTEQVAERVDRAAGYLRSHDIEDLAADFQDFTRRHPEVVLSGLFIAGLAAARVLKAAMPEPQRTERTRSAQEYPYSEGYAVGGGEAGSGYQSPEVYPAGTPGRV